MKFGVNWPSDLRLREEESLKIMFIYMYIALGQGQTTPREVLLHKHNYSGCKFSPQFSPFKHRGDQI